MKKNILSLLLLLITQFFCIEKTHAASSVTATTPFSISMKTDSTEEMDDLFYDYVRNESEEKRLRTMANITFLLGALAFLTFGLTLTGAIILGIITFIKAKAYRKRLKYLNIDDPLYESHKKISNLSKAAFAIALIPFALIFGVFTLLIIEDGSDIAITPIFFGAIGNLTFLGLERFVFRTNDIK